MRGKFFCIQHASLCPFIHKDTYIHMDKVKHPKLLTTFGKLIASRFRSPWAKQLLLYACPDDHLFFCRCQFSRRDENRLISQWRPPKRSGGWYFLLVPLTRGHIHAALDIFKATEKDIRLVATSMLPNHVPKRSCCKKYKTAEESNSAKLFIHNLRWTIRSLHSWIHWKHLWTIRLHLNWNTLGSL